jgi:hypothetical protein
MLLCRIGAWEICVTPITSACNWKCTSAYPMHMAVANEASTMPPCPWSFLFYKSSVPSVV